MRFLKWAMVMVLCIILIPAVAGCESGSPSTPVDMTTPEDNIRSLIIEELDWCNREGVEKVSKIDIVNAGYGYNVDVHFAIDDNLSESWIIDGAWMDIRDTMETLYTSGIDIQWVDMHGSFSMVDRYGNAEEMEVIHARLGRDTAAKINWENMIADGLFDILDFEDIHPAFR